MYIRKDHALGKNLMLTSCGGNAARRRQGLMSQGRLGVKRSLQTFIEGFEHSTVVSEGRRNRGDTPGALGLAVRELMDTLACCC